MLSAWDVYWVMQLDSIGAAAWIVSGVLGLGCLVSLIAGAVVSSEGQHYPELEISRKQRENGARLTSFGRRYFPWALGLGLVAAFLPSTKTAAAMIVVPAIVNNETLHREAGELYGLAKRALSDALGDEKPAK